MSKKNAYTCQSCGSVHFKWSGKCPDCGDWNSMIEEFAEGGAGKSSHFSHMEDSVSVKNASSSKKSRKIELVDLNGEAKDFPRIDTGIKELDRVLGGGLVKGSVVLIGGDPGIGKSTLLLQTAQSLAQNKNRVVYISGEESVDQVRLRAKRLSINQENVQLASTTNVAEIIASIIIDKQPTIVIIDSIQTMFVEDLSSAPGTVSQVRASAFELTVFAKKFNVTLLIVSHVTKDGQLAGPKVLEHMVDTVLYFEGEKDLHFRILRAVKNRFGAANEIGVFEMNDTGLAEVSNPSELFLNHYERDTSGTAIFGGIEGTRPILAEIQALVSPSFMPMPRRSVVGWDNNRLAMIIAVINNRFGLNLFDKEIYLNIVGGLKIVETSADLAVACALISSAKDIPFVVKGSASQQQNASNNNANKNNSATIAIGEIGLTGEVRMVGNLEARLKEAVKLGFTDCLVPKGNSKNKNFDNIKKTLPQLNLHLIEHIRDLAKFFKK